MYERVKNRENNKERGSKICREKKNNQKFDGCGYCGESEKENIHQQLEGLLLTSKYSEHEHQHYYTSTCSTNAIALFMICVKCCNDHK